MKVARNSILCGLQLCELPSQDLHWPVMDAQRSIFAGAFEVDCRTISSGSTAISST